MKQWIKAAGTGKKGSRDLSYDEAVAAAHAIARGESTDAQTAAFFMAVRMKGEAENEIMAFIDVFRKYSLPYASFSDSLNCAGPYDGRHLFPVTIPVSLMLASVGFPQVLHGSDSLPPKLGTSIRDLLEGLGVRTDLTARDWETIFSSVKMGFIWTDRMCPALAQIRKVREEIGLRTFVNTVEKILNPVHSHNMIIGVNHRTAMQHLVQILPKAGLHKAMIVQGMEGSEDVSITKTSAIRVVTPYGDETTVLDPSTFGFRGEPLLPIEMDVQLELLNRVMQGDDSPEIRSEREHVIFNTGLRLYWYERVGTYEEGFQLARQLYARKEAWKVLKKWKEMTKLYDRDPKRQAN
jgi:anthranilate phosphoribosyltransferase